MSSLPRRQRRPRKTSARVRWIDRVTGVGIRVGGVMVIVSVVGMFLFLLGEVLPLFGGASLTPLGHFAVLSGSQARSVVHARLDEYRTLGIYLLRSGEVGWFDAATGRKLGERLLFEEGLEGAALSSVAPDGRLAIGLPDGRARTARLGMKTEFIPPEEATPELRGLAPGQRKALPDGVVERTTAGDLRKVVPDLAIGQPLKLADGVAIELIDLRAREDVQRLAALGSDGQIYVSQLRFRKNLLTGEVTETASTRSFALPADLTQHPEPRFLLASANGGQLFVAWADGLVARFDLRDPANPVLAERATLCDASPTRLNILELTPGEQSLISGDSSGQVRIWFLLESGSGSADSTSAGSGRPADLGSTDGRNLVMAHSFQELASIQAIGLSQRDKRALVATADGHLSVYHTTTERLRAAARIEPPAPVTAARITPKADGLFVLTADGAMHGWDMRDPHPEVSLKALLGKVWYEGYPRPEHSWQSSSGTSDFEPKLSFVPLIFGTLKATLYSMLFAVPIALSAAIYTSEFLHARLRAPIKTTVELMASLPSVVLGFIAALVLAPLVESWVLATLTAFVVAPTAALAFGYAWQMAPTSWTRRLRGLPELALMLAVVLLSLGIPTWLGSLIERTAFAGDFKGWLDGRFGSGAPGTALLAWPIVVAVLLFADRALVVPRLGRRRRPSRSAEAALELTKYISLLAVSVLIAWGAGRLGDAVGYDPRGGVLGTYVQRNALIVGFVMGFAVIPIIYTIAEDALSAVPRSLRSASLGCGATRWQTATRVVLPVAASGIFSALMIGLGRAVGETMIVLMAAGNTPVLELNPFSGLRTLSANIAVELPEAAKGGSLYRLLFLSALTLLILTFVINTAAELIRQRFRRRAYQL